MGWLSIRKNSSAVSSSRSNLRKQLHKAARGNTKAFQSIADQSLDFITEFLVVTGYHDPDRIRSYTRDIFHNLWSRIAYIRRVSDFERQLFIFLKQIPVNVAPFQDILIQKLVMLNALQRFMVVARELENWSYKNLSLATRIPRQELSDPLYEAWKIMAGFKTTELDYNTHACMQKIVENLEGLIDQSEQQRLCQKVQRNRVASGFKAECLNVRCDLVELRQNSRWEPVYKSNFLNELKEDISLITPVKPVLSERLMNQVSFKSASLEIRGS